MIRMSGICAALQAADEDRGIRSMADGGCPRCSEDDLTPEQIDADLEDQAARIEETTCA